MLQVGVFIPCNKTSHVQHFLSNMFRYTTYLILQAHGGCISRVECSYLPFRSRYPPTLVSGNPEAINVSQSENAYQIEALLSTVNNLVTFRIVILVIYCPILSSQLRLSQQVAHSHVLFRRRSRRCGRKSFIPKKPENEVVFISVFSLHSVQVSAQRSLFPL